MYTDHVNISQAFVQGELLPGDGHNGKVCISSPPGYDEDPLYVYRLLKPLYGMPSAARAWHTTMSAFLSKEGCATVGFEKSMWTVTIDGARILLGAHIDDFAQRSEEPLFEEEEEGISVASDVVKAKGEDPDTPCYLRGDRVRLGRWRSRIVGASPLARSR